MEQKMKFMLKEMYEEEHEIEEKELLDFQNAFDIVETEAIELTDEEENYMYKKEISCNVDIPIEYKRKVIEFWRSGKKKPRKIESVKVRFRKVSSIRQLRRWEKQLNEGGNRLEKLRQISAYTLDKCNEALERGAIIHDIDIMQWALQAQQEENVPGFKASYGWVRKFKIAHKIVSRKITKFTTKETLMSRVAFETENNKFIENVKYYIARFGIENVYNSDQSDFQLEFHVGSTLAQKGIEQVESEHAITYTIQPIISADGRLLSPLLIVLKESSEKLDPRVQKNMFTENNIFIMTSKSGKLTSHHFQIWLKEVCFSNVGPKSVLLLDSWNGRYLDIIQRNKPESEEDIVLLTIPTGTTERIQPLHIFSFLLWKNCIKYFSDIIMLSDPEVQLDSRNAILKLQSLTHNQFSSPRFRNLFKYAWYRSGYVENRPAKFETPVDFCLKKHSKLTCDICDGIGIITCAWCKKSLCITHFYHFHHLCNQYEP